MILVFGSPRSGTTWLGKIFDSHPETLYRHEPDSVLRATDLPLFISPDTYDQYRDAAREYVQTVVAVRSTKVSGKLPLFAKSYHRMGSNQVRRAVIVGAKAAERFLGPVSIPDFISSSQQSKLTFVWKSIESNGRLGLFARVIPACRVVHIVRHPCGTIASVLRGESVGGFVASEPASEDYGIIQMLLQTPQARSRKLTMPMLRSITPVERLAWIWALTNEKVMDDLNDLDNSRTIRYEDLCAEPEITARDLFEFTGLRWSSQSEAFVGNSVGHEDRRFHSVFKDPHKSAYKWRDELSVDDQQRILQVVKDTRPGKLFVNDHDEHRVPPPAE